jgi:cytochrome b involved in lipid metabolism
MAAGASLVATCAYQDINKFTPTKMSHFKLHNPLTPLALSFAQDKEWPVFRRAEVQKKSREEKKIWVTYKDGVYDLTPFAKSHPGGADKV